MTLWLSALIASASLAAVQDFESFFRRGLELSADGRDLEALEEFRQAERLEPRHPLVLYNIGILLERQGRVAEALGPLGKAVELAPGERRIQFAWGAALFSAGRKGEAREPLERAAAAPAPVPEALELLAAVYEAEGKLDDALARLQQYLELRPEDGEARLVLGDQLAGAKRYDEAVEVWKGGLGDVKRRAELSYRIADTLGRNRETYGEAESYLRDALAADSGHLKAALLLARVLARTGRTEGAVDVLQAALEKHPQSPDVHFMLASAYQQLGRPEEARQARALFQKLSAEEEAREHRRTRIAVSYKRARELLDQGQMAEAQEGFKAVVELDPENAVARSMLAKIAYSKGRLGEARHFIAEAIEKDGAVGEFHYLAGLFAVRGGERSLAESAVRRSLELAPGFADAWLLLGSLLADSGRPEEAVDCFRKAEALEPENPAVQLNLAGAYRALGKAELEQQAMERYRSLTARESKK